eukprot:TRINITY_DN2813_c0_g1_i1.p1 TRINITY_DN2813_c0_g1~~TRINITY_DN2813_c0_g1_i1.p1  ORF type:complete len:410 (+),score=68.19 TRINITY_DN2813_c0_g1_i1:42-1232(+)
MEGQRPPGLDVECTTVEIDPVDPLSPRAVSKALLPAMTYARKVGSEKYTNKRVRKFYKRQNEFIDMLMELHEQRDDDEDEEGSNNKKVAIGVYGSLAVNVVLWGMKLYATIASGSVSVLASLLDSCLDLLSGIILSVTNWYMRKQDPVRFPVGKSRFEPLGVLIFSVVMFMSTVQLLIKAVNTLMDLSSVDVKLNVFTYAAMGCTIVFKFFLMLYCRKNAHLSESVAALGDDHRNDVLSNSVGVLGAILASRGILWADSTAAIIICVYIMVVWIRTGYEKMQVLSGRAASPELIKKLTYIAMTHHELAQVDTVRAYAVSEGFNVEVDIILPETMTLKEAHDIGETLQHKIELEDEVERAYVHLDYEADHNPWGEHKGWDKPRAQYFRPSQNERSAE